jgi:hypothetical protein
MPTKLIVKTFSFNFDWLNLKYSSTDLIVISFIYLKHSEINNSIIKKIPTCTLNNTFKSQSSLSFHPVITFKSVHLLIPISIAYTEQMCEIKEQNQLKGIVTWFYIFSQKYLKQTNMMPNLAFTDF